MVSEVARGGSEAVKVDQILNIWRGGSAWDGTVMAGHIHKFHEIDVALHKLGNFTTLIFSTPQVYQLVSAYGEFWEAI